MLNAVLDTWMSFAKSPWNCSSFLFPISRSSSQNSGKFILDRFHTDMGSLQYKLFVPGSYTGAPLALIVMLHGGGQDADDFALGTGMNELAERCGCLVVYPEQSAGANWSRWWNWYDKAHHRRGRGEPSLIAGITRKVLAEYAVDTTCVYVAGFSSGGAMAVILGQTYPDLFAAVGCHSGLAYGSATDHYSAMLAMRDGPDLHALANAEPLANVPTIVFHGDLDFSVHVKNGIGVVQQSVNSHMHQTPHMRQQLATSSEACETGGQRFTRQVHRGRTGNIVAEQWILHGAGHAWSGGSRRGSYTDPKGPNASMEMLRFFLQHHVDHTKRRNYPSSRLGIVR